MKNKYFGDINDYRKYGLIRAIFSSNRFSLLVAWMLTPDDSSNDGKRTDYLNKPDEWWRYDSELYKGLQRLMSNPRARNVRLIENTKLLPDAKYFSHEVPDPSKDRRDWFLDLLSNAKDSDLVFLDPDNVRIPTQVATRFRFIPPPDSDLSRHRIPKHFATPWEVRKGRWINLMKAAKAP